jgi:NitT/TauT family transport system substrate-binding protein
MFMQKTCLVVLVVGVLIMLCPLAALAEPRIQIYAPPTPSSIPFLLAARHLDNMDVTIFANQSQAHTLFLRDDVQILVTGLSVGINFFKEGVPVRIVNSYVSGLTYLVTSAKPVQHFRELQGQELYLPFEGSPIEEVTKFFVKQEGLDLKNDFKVVYSPFPAMLELLKKGQAKAVALPEPSVTIALTQGNGVLSFGYKDRWDELTGGITGYPQVGTFVKMSWAVTHQDLLQRLNQELANALQLIRDNPQQAVALTKSQFQFAEPVLLTSLTRTAFDLKIGQALKQDIIRYYQLIGTPLDEQAFNAFFDLDSQ